VLSLPFSGIAQQSMPDSLRGIYYSSKEDSIIYKAGIHMYDYYEEVNRDSAFFYADQCVRISRKNNKKINEAHVLTRRAYQELNLGRYAESLQSLLASFEISQAKGNDNAYWDVGTLSVENEKKLYALNCAHHIYGILMRETWNNDQAVIHFKEAKKIAVRINSNARSLLASLNLGRIYLEKGNYDSALYHENDARSIIDSSGWEKYLSTILYYSGRAYMGKGDTIQALRAFYQSIESAIKQNNTDALTRGYHNLANYHITRKQKDSSVYYAVKSVDVMKKLGAVTQIEYHLGNAYEGLHDAYQLNNQFDSAYKYIALAQAVNDSINQRRIRSLAEFQKLTLDEQQRLQASERDRVLYRNKIRTAVLLAGIAVLLLLAVIFYRNNRQKQKAKIKIEHAYDNLKSTQQQLIQAEKMASLGELTAGIAHEIQNPLNFVNNFSEVNKELADELKTELATGNTQLVNEIADDIKGNSEKINHHGKRADAIVKGMLQHSRTSSGQKEPTNINVLADEYLRLAYHGLRAKDKSFNATTKTDYDESIANINIIPQDIGRCILNLITNAFYAITEKKKLAGAGYEPTMTISTKKLNDMVLIRVRDNGMGIPQKIRDKIFQPFFTTKPTGQGTGLGLSLSYDIVKAHGGELKVESMEGEWTEFIIQLPLTQTN
jgi:signal transduction histidine kinase/predicted negative regulator of RcsB-dependent stress response